jgi:hypothetical protein
LTTASPCFEPDIRQRRDLAIINTRPESEEGQIIPSDGPINVANACTVTADPDVFKSQISTNDPPETANAGPPKMPANARHIARVWIFFASPAPIVNSMKMGRLTKYTIFLPKTSLSGALNIGPSPSPTTYMDRPSNAVVIETLNSAETSYTLAA